MQERMKNPAVLIPEPIFPEPPHGDDMLASEDF